MREMTQIKSVTFRRAIGEQRYEQGHIVDMFQVGSDVLHSPRQFGPVGEVVQVIEHDTLTAGHTSHAHRGL